MSDTKRTASISDLQDCISTIGALAHEGLREIEAVAKLALSYMESPEAYRHPENIAQALHAIWGMAERTMGCIESEASAVGCCSANSAQIRRWAASHAHDKGLRSIMS